MGQLMGLPALPAGRGLLAHWVPAGGSSPLSRRCACLPSPVLHLTPSIIVQLPGGGAAGWAVRRGLLFYPSGIAEMLQRLFLLCRGRRLRLCSATVPGVAGRCGSLLCRHRARTVPEKPLGTSSDGWHEPWGQGGDRQFGAPQSP